jgi:ectoine hydroxylase-related dioxygenase (phytanoyl-CoA dioxygenase family)
MLTRQLLSAFDELGYLHLPGALGPDELLAVREVADALMSHPQYPDDYKYGALVGDEIGEGTTLCRIEYSLHKDRQFLKLLGNPAVVAAAVALHPILPVLTWEDVIIKMARSGFAVPFHQDTLYQSTRSRVFSIGVYFDDSDEDPLIALPGSHRGGALPPDEVRAVVARSRDRFVAIPVRAGDLLIHNVLMVHGSGENVSERTRRVLYLEFRTCEQLRTDSPWAPEWVNRRLPYVPAAIRLRRADPVLSREDERFGPEVLRASDEYLRLAADPPPLDAIDFRVHHDEVAPAAGR